MVTANDDTRFFTMNQLWQSIAITAVLLGGVAIYVTQSSRQQAHAPAAALATTTQLSASAVTATPSNPFNGLILSGQAAIVVDLTNGHTLYSENADTPLPLASLTKLLTIYAATGALTSASPVTITSTALAQDGDYGLSEGETFAYSDIARLALVASSNDAAEAIAEAAGTAKNQSPTELLSSAIQNAGLTHTTATNGTGLDIDATEAGAYGSARDVAKLASEVLRVAPDVAEATKKLSISVHSTSGVLHTLPNTNPDVASLPGMLLSKTGYTDLAGGNLAIIFDAGFGHPIAVVVLGSTRNARFTDVEKLMNATLAQFAGTSTP